MSLTIAYRLQHSRGIHTGLLLLVLLITQIGFWQTLAAVIGARLCLEQEEIDDLVFLIQYHLFIPENALRRDLEDQAFIKRCAETIGSSERLAMLYLLSVADSRATGPSAWSDWKAVLMKDMYFKVQAYLDHPDEAVDMPAMVDRQYEEGIIWLREQVLELGYVG